MSLNFSSIEDVYGCDYSELSKIIISIIILRTGYGS